MNIRENQDVQFWLYKPTELVDTITLVPRKDMTSAEKYNTLSRIVILISAIMYMYKNPYAIHFLGAGLVIIAMMYTREYRESFVTLSPNHTIVPDNANRRNYTNNDYEVAPYTVPLDLQIGRTIRKENEPYSMPSLKTALFDEHASKEDDFMNVVYRVDVPHHTFDGRENFITNRLSAEQQFIDSTMEQRSVIDEYKDKLNRERKHSCMDLHLNTASAGSGGTI